MALVYFTKKVGARVPTQAAVTASSAWAFGSAAVVVDREVQAPTGFFIDSFTATTVSLDWDTNLEGDIEDYTVEYVADASYPGGPWTVAEGIVASFSYRYGAYGRDPLSLPGEGG